MTKGNFAKTTGGTDIGNTEPWYMAIYPFDYMVWFPRRVFRASFQKVGVPSKDNISTFTEYDKD